MKRVYISGDTTNDNREVIHSTFEEAEKSLKDLGLFPINPLKNGLPNTATWEDHMEVNNNYSVKDETIRCRLQ